MYSGLTGIVGALNFFPGLKTKLAAVAALILAIVSAWNAAAPAFGVGPCISTLAEVAKVAVCTTDWTVHVPDIVNTLVLALLGVGAANSPVNTIQAAQAAPLMAPPSSKQGPA